VTVRYALIRDGVVTNLIEWDGASQWAPPAGEIAQPFANGAVNPGWLWNDGNPVDPNPHPDPEPYTGPITVSRLRLKLELAERGLLDDGDAAVAASGGVAPLYWANATTFESDHPLSIAIGRRVGLSAAQVRALFQAAAERDA
jgi:hypothetical protein